MKETFERKVGKPRTPKIPASKLTSTSIGPIAAGIATAVCVVVAGGKEANADKIYYAKGTKFGENMIVGTPNFMHGFSSDRFKATFTCDPDQSGDWNVCEKEMKIDDNSDNGITMRGLGNIAPVHGLSKPDLFEYGDMEIDRGDGRVTKIYGDDNGLFATGGIPKWEKWPLNTSEDWLFNDGICYASMIGMPYPSVKTTNEIRIQAKGFYWPWTDPFVSSDGCCWDKNGVPGGLSESSIWHVKIAEEDYCFAIQQAVNEAWFAGKTPSDIEILEKGTEGFSNAPVTKTITALGTDNTNIFAGNPEDGLIPIQYQYQTKKWIPQEAGKNYMEDFNHQTHVPALLDVKTPDGKSVTLFVFDYESESGAIQEKQAYAVKDNGDGTFFDELTITMEDDPSAEPDDDEDGRINKDEEGDATTKTSGCRWRANPDGIDKGGANGVADGIEDACQALCSEFPGVVETPSIVSISGLRICASELGYENAFSDDFGSTFHSNKDVSLGADKTEILLSSDQILRYIDSWDPRTDKSMKKPMTVVFPEGSSVKFRINSVKHLDGGNGKATLVFSDGTGIILGGDVDWQNFGVDEVSKLILEEGADIEIEIGNENPLPVVEQGAESAQTVEVSVQAELPAQVELPMQAELPTQVETPVQQPEPATIAEVPMPVVEPTAEFVPDVVENPPETDDESVVAPPADTVSPPEVDTAPVAPDAPLSDTLLDMPPSLDEAGQSNPESVQDTAQNPDTNPKLDTEINVSGLGEDSQQLDTIPAEDKKNNTDTPVQGKDSEKPQSLTDASQNADLIQPKPESPDGKNGGGGCSCAIENPQNDSWLNTFAVLGSVALALGFRFRRRVIKATSHH